MIGNAENIGINRSISSIRSRTFESYDMILIGPSIYESALEPFI